MPNLAHNLDKKPDTTQWSWDVDEKKNINNFFYQPKILRFDFDVLKNVICFCFSASKNVAEPLGTTIKTELTFISHSSTSQDHCDK